AVRYDSNKGSSISVWDLGLPMKESLPANRDDESAASAILQIPPGECAGNCDFSLDGRLLAVSRQAGSIDIYDLAARTRRQRLAGTLPTYQLRFHPNGGQLAVSRLNDPVVQIYDLSSGKPSASLSHDAAVHGISWSSDGKQLASACT